MNHPLFDYMRLFPSLLFSTYPFVVLRSHSGSPFPNGTVALYDTPSTESGRHCPLLSPVWHWSPWWILRLLLSRNHFQFITCPMWSENVEILRDRRQVDEERVARRATSRRMEAVHLEQHDGGLQKRKHHQRSAVLVQVPVVRVLLVHLLPTGVVKDSPALSVWELFLYLEY